MENWWSKFNKQNSFKNLGGLLGSAWVLPHSSIPIKRYDSCEDNDNFWLWSMTETAILKVYQILLTKIGDAGKSHSVELKSGT